MPGQKNCAAAGFTGPACTRPLRSIIIIKLLALAGVAGTI